MDHNTVSILSHPQIQSPLSQFRRSSLKSLVSGVCHHFRRIQTLQLPIRFFILLSLSSLYFFTSNPRRPIFFLDSVSGVAFVIVFILFFNNLALPHLHLLRSRLSPKLSVSRNPPPSPPVVWSIGSNPKPETISDSGSTGVQVFSNGDTYEGEFHKGRCSGSGVYNYFMKGKYEGDWIDGKYDGYGVETWAKGSRYRGQYRQGMRHGIGVYRFYTGDVYTGEWYNGQCHGCGVYTCRDGSRYVGGFKWGAKHGLGHYQYRNGDMYSGEYFGDKIHGFGVYRFKNGHRYEGSWHEGRRQGLGSYTFRNGETQSGHWQNGSLDARSTTVEMGSTTTGVDSAKVVRAVQEAKSAAAKAENPTKVDEMVKKTLAAANRAANAARVAAVKAVQKQVH